MIRYLVIQLIIPSFLLLPTFLLIGCDSPTNPNVTSQSNRATEIPAHIDADLKTAQRLLKQRKFSEAIPYLERTLSKPLESYTKSLVLTMIGNCYNELDQWEKSLDYHNRAINEDPNNYKAYVNRGIVYRLMGDYDKAAQSYSTALELAPDYAELHASMGALAVFQGNYELAIEHLKRAIELDDSLAVAHSNLALAYASVARFDEAEQELKKAVLRGYHQPEVIKKRIEQLQKISENDKSN